MEKKYVDFVKSLEEYNIIKKGSHRNKKVMETIRAVCNMTEEEIRKIVSLMFKELEQRCKEQMDIDLTVRDSVKDYISETGFDAKYGARPLRRAIQTKVEDALAEEILEGRVKRGDTVAVGYVREKIRFIVK